jgi:hypothetical protein
MRRTFLFLILLLMQSPWPLWGQDAAALPADLHEFLTRYEDSLELLDPAYDELAVESLPLRNEWGQPLARRRIDDRQRALEDLRKTIRQLRVDPLDLVLTTRLLIKSETLVDDLFDLSQTAYDNNSEELGKRLADLMRTADRHNGIVESYALHLATRHQARLRELQKENQRLQQKPSAAVPDRGFSPRL